MRILTIKQIKELDRRTIDEEQISSLDLMERAAVAITDALCQLFQKPRRFKVFAGPGNNGGDALAVARMLAEREYEVEAYLFNTTGKMSDDCLANAERLLDYPQVNFVEITQQFTPPALYKTDVIIDGLFGSGLNKPLEGGFAAMVRYINASPAQVVAIDVPSGLMGEDNTMNTMKTVVKADVTLTLQMPKLAFFFAENQKYIGEWFCLNIGLSENVIQEMHSSYAVIRKEEVCALMRPREVFAHKGNFGHALLIAGSYGMAGASILSARACLRSGVGLLTVHVPRCNTLVLQTAIPEAMVSTDVDEWRFTMPKRTDTYNAVAIGPGLGQGDSSAQALFEQIKMTNKPMVVDADALNLLARNNNWLMLLPKGSILTPHPKEFERIAGPCSNSYERINKAIEIAQRYQLYIILKGAWSVVVTPDGNCHFNPTGNPGMATAGSGDVLTGVLLALLAQGYSPQDAAIMGTYLHGVAGDMAAESKGENGLIATDIVENLPLAWQRLEKNQYLCGNKEQQCF